MSANPAKVSSPVESPKLSALDAILKRRIEEALADPAPSIPHAQVVAEMNALYAKRRV